MSINRRWLICDCSAGLGRALAEAVAQSGQRVLAVARSPEAADELRDSYPTLATCVLDVRDADDCHNAIEAGVARFGGLDVVVHHDDYSHAGAVEQVRDEDLVAQLAASVLAPWRLVRMVLPQMRRQGQGDVVLIAPGSGAPAGAGLGAYTAAMRALGGMVETLGAELAGSGVRVTALEPGSHDARWAELVGLRDAWPTWQPQTGQVSLAR